MEGRRYNPFRYRNIFAFFPQAYVDPQAPNLSKIAKVDPQHATILSHKLVSSPIKERKLKRCPKIVDYLDRTSLWQEQQCLKGPSSLFSFF